MAKTCLVCNEKIGFGDKQNAADGIICARCSALAPNFRLENIETITGYFNENQARGARFQKTAILKGFMSTDVVIDSANKLFYYGTEKNPRPIYYTFDEVAEYNLEKYGEETITKSRGGIGRAVVGGVLFGGVGAVVGAATSQTETTTSGGIPMIKLTVKAHSGKKVISIANPPDGFIPFLDSIIEC